MNKKSLSLPYVLWMAIFVIVPLIIVIYFAFTTSDGAITLDNLAKAGMRSQVLINSIELALISTAICLLLGFPLAIIISRYSMSTQRTMVLLLMLPMWMNFLLRTYAWMTILEKNGIINRFLGLFGIEPLQMINTKGAVVLGMVYNFLPYMIMPIYSILTKMDNSVIEAAQDLGAGKRSVFTKVVLPLSVPGVISGITMVFVPALSTFIISRLLGGGSILIGDVIEMQLLGSSYNPNLGAAMSLILMIIVLICMGVMNSFDNSDNKEGMAG